MRQYWINFKGNQQGPMSKEQLAQMGLDNTAYVWHSGLPDWVKITAVPELSDIISQPAGQQPAPEDQDTQPEPTPEAIAQDITEPQEEVPPLDVVVSDYSQGNEPAPNYMQPQQYQAPAQQQYPEPVPNLPQQQEPCPPSNLVWAIIATVLCCSVPGIIGIVFAFLTKKYYREGNIEKAKRMSDYGAWAIIFSIMLGLLTMPLSCALKAL